MTGCRRSWYCQRTDPAVGHLPTNNRSFADRVQGGDGRKKINGGSEMTRKINKEQRGDVREISW